MNSLFFNQASRFIILILFQVLIFNHINFLGYINPYIYISLIAFFPIRNNRVFIILISFILGLVIDLFLDTGGIHAAACVFIAYLRPLILKSSFGLIYEHQTIHFNTVDFGSKFSYITLLTIVHHIVLFSLEIFNFSKIILILQKALFSSIFSIILIILITIIFSKKTK